MNDQHGNWLEVFARKLHTSPQAPSTYWAGEPLFILLEFLYHSPSSSISPSFWGILWAGVPRPTADTSSSPSRTNEDTVWFQSDRASSSIPCLVLFLKIIDCSLGKVDFGFFSSCQGRVCRKFSRTYCKSKDHKLVSCICCKWTLLGILIYRKLQAPLPLSALHSLEWESCQVKIQLHLEKMTFPYFLITFIQLRFNL